MLIVIAASTDVTVLSLQCSMEVTRRQANAVSVDVVQESFDSALALQRSLQLSHRQGQPGNAGIDLDAKLGDMSALGLQRSMQLIQRNVNISAVGLQRQPDCPVGLQYAMQSTRRGSSHTDLDVSGPSILGLQRSTQIKRFRSVA